MHEKVFVKTIKYKHGYKIIGLTFEKFDFDTAAIVRVRSIFLMFNFISLHKHLFFKNTHTHTYICICVCVCMYATIIF